MAERVQEPSDTADMERLPTGPQLRRTDGIQTAAQVIVAVAIVLAICYVAKLVLIVLLVSVLLAFTLAPVVDACQGMRVPRGVAAAIAVVLLLAVMYGMTYFFYSRAVAFANDLPRYSEKIKRTVGRLRQHAERIQHTTETILPSEPENRGTVRVEQQRSWAEAVTHGMGTVWDLALSISFVPFLVYFMLTWQEHARAATVMLFRLEHRNTAYVTLGRISAMIRSFLVGNVLMGIFMGGVSTVVFGSLHLPYFYFIGFISGFMSLIPYLGPIIAVLPPLAAGLGQLHGGGVVVILITVFGLHLFALNVFYPKLIGKQLQLNPLVVTMSLLIWGWIWGAVGIILAVPITAALKIIFDHVESLRPYGAWLGE